MWWAETLQDEEKYPETEKKIENVKKNLLAYFDTDYIKGLFATSKADFKTVASEGEYTTTKLNGTKETEVRSSFWILGESGKKWTEYSKRHIKWSTDEKYTYFKAWPNSDLEEKIDETEYTTALTSANEIQKNKTLEDTKTFLEKIDTMIVIIPHKRWKYWIDDGNAWITAGSERTATGSNWTDIKNISLYRAQTNTIYVPDTVSELSLAHEIMHALQHNFHWTKNLLALNDGKITWVSKELWTKFLQQENGYNEDITYQKDSLLEDDRSWQELAWELEALKEEYKGNLQDKEYLKESKMIEKAITSLNKQELKDKNLLTAYKDAKINVDTELDEKYKKISVSDTEFHARLFELKYACTLYLWVKLWDPITLDDIDQLKENEQYLADNKDTYDFIDYVRFIDKEMTAEQDPKVRLKLFEDRLTVLTALLELANNDLVMNDSTPWEQPIQKA